MNCPGCGTPVENDACFCGECGIALAQSAPNTYQAPPANPYQAPPSQPTAPYNAATQKCGVNIVYPDGHNEIGDLYISPTELTFVKKSKAVRLAFGFLGSAIENGTEALRINVCDIVYNKTIYYPLTLNFGSQAKMQEFFYCSFVFFS